MQRWGVALSFPSALWTLFCLKKSTDPNLSWMQTVGKGLSFLLPCSLHLPVSWSAVPPAFPVPRNGTSVSIAGRGLRNCQSLASLPRVSQSPTVPAVPPLGPLCPGQLLYVQTLSHRECTARLIPYWEQRACLATALLRMLQRLPLVCQITCNLLPRKPRVPALKHARHPTSPPSLLSQVTNLPR